jgi:hypothetical protein
MREETHAEVREVRQESRYEPPAPSPVPAPRAEEPRIDPKALLESAGLVMIETDRSKAPPVQVREEEPAHLGRPRRERTRPQPKDDELQQVETKR